MILYKIWLGHKLEYFHSKITNCFIKFLHACPLISQNVIEIDLACVLAHDTYIIYKVKFVYKIRRSIKLPLFLTSSCLFFWHRPCNIFNHCFTHLSFELNKTPNINSNFIGMHINKFLFKWCTKVLHVNNIIIGFTFCSILISTWMLCLYQ